ncbi:MAG: SiaB family protein kinase, partial [Arcobacteraceae bacterium]|nr:SiaB family protein kinase [Arcobacteraceae bacterium]
YEEVKENKLNLTKEEKQWIKNHPVINVGGVRDWAPFSFVNENNKNSGLSNDYLKEIEKISGLKFKYHIQPWGELIDSIKDGSIDILPAIYMNDDRKKYMNFTSSYLTLSEYFFTRDDYRIIKSMKELDDEVIAVIKNSNLANWLKNNYPKIKTIEKPTLLDCLRSIESKESDIYISDNPSVTYNIENNLLTNIKINSIVQVRKPTKLYMATKKEYKVLAQIITKALVFMTRNQKRTIASNWMSVINKNKLNFSDKEQKWIDKKEPITYVYDTDWAPFEWDNALKKHTGIIADILNLIEHKTGIDFKAIHTDTWADAVKLAQNKKVNMYSAVMQNSDREKYMNFTKKYIYNCPAVFVTKLNDTDIYLDLKKDLKYKKIGVTKGNALGKYVKNKYPKLTYVDVDSTKDGFDRVDDGEIDLFVVNGATAEYYIKRKGYENIRIGNRFDFMFGLKIAISKGMPKEVLSILNKAIDSISDKEIDDIYYKWTEVRIEQKTDWILIGQISGVIFLIFIFILFNNRKLKSMVEIKTKDLKDVLDSMEVTINERTQELNDEKNFVNSVMNSQENFVITSDGECLRSANKAFFDFYNIKSIKEFRKIYGDCICNTFDINAPKEYLQKIIGNERWADYIYNRPYEIHKVSIQKDKIKDTFTVTADKLIFKGDEIKVVVFSDVTELEKQKNHLQKFFNNKGAGILIVDANRRIIEVNNKFCEMWGYREDEIVGENAQVLHISQKTFQNFGKIAFEQVAKDHSVEIEYQWKRKDKSIFWANFSGEPLSIEGDVLWVINDITLIKDAQKELNDEKELINSIMDAQENLVITSDGTTFKSVNKAFLGFFNIKLVEEFIEIYGMCVCDAFKKDVDKEFLQKDMDGIAWIDYIFNNSNKTHKVVMDKDNISHIFSITVDRFDFGGEKLVTVVFSDITMMEKVTYEMKEIHKHTKDSIEYASLIQGALIPDKNLFDNYFQDSFVIWHPKDIVGGDIYLFEELRDKNECLLMCIDCTGHGVPGAFVTMLVKAIERQIVAKIEHDKYHDIDISPAWILSYFNKNMKLLLKQDNKDSLSNAGFDGGIIYYNKKDKILKFSGAEIPLFYFDKNGEFKTIKGSRHSVGYKKCNVDYDYKEHIIDVKEGMKFYITTDGYLDQNGGEKDFPFGKKRFINIIKENEKEPMAELQTALLYKMMDYEAMVDNNERNDDITVIGFEIKDDGMDTILEYNGELTQGIITHVIDTIENKVLNINMMSKVSTIAIELTQNMMNYSKSYDENCYKIIPAGYIEVTKDKDDKFYLNAKNIISKEDKEKIEPKLLEIQSLDINGIKKRYRELRRSGQNTHAKGGGIGFYEIAKLSQDINFEFKSINKDKYHFLFNITVERRLKDRS